MADAADSTPTPGGQSALTVDDLNITVNHEPRVSHKRLAKALGYADDRKLLQLAARHRAALERFGPISATVAENADPRGRGRPGREEWYNKRQSLYLCAKSEMENATETTIAMVEVFDAHLAGRLAKPVAVAGHTRALPKPKRAPRAEAPATAPPVIERDGYAAVRLGGETLIVDLLHLDIGPGARGVTFGWEEGVAVEDMSGAKPNHRLLGKRCYAVPDATRKTGYRAVFVVGTVVAAQPATSPAKGARPRAPGRPPKREAAPPRPLPDLASAVPLGAA